MTAPADLAEVRAALALAEQATPGAWSSEDGSTTWGDDTDLWSSIRDASGAVVSDMFEVTGRAHRQVSADAAAIVALRNAAPAIAAAVEELEDARAEIASAREQLDRLRSAVDEREGDMHMRIRAGYDKTVADAWRAAVAKRDAEIAALNRQVCRLVSGQEIDGDRLCQHHGADVAALALLSDERAAHAETSRDLDALLTALGAQVTPGAQTEDACHARRVADGMRRAAAMAARPISEWYDDLGSALWWRFPVEEPPYSGTPLDSDWPGYHTHWTPIICPDDPHSEADADPASRGLIGGGS